MKRNGVAVGCFLIGTLLGSTTCAEGKDIEGGPVKGVVTDKESGRPVAGAIVIAHWELFFQGHSSWEACYHAEVTMTGSDGRYNIPRWTASVKDSDPPLYRDWSSWLRGSKHLKVYAFRPEYRMGWSYQGDKHPPDIRLDGRDASLDEKIESWARWLGAKNRCLNRREALAPTLRRIYETAQLLSGPDTERWWTNTMLYHVEEAEFGYDVAHSRSVARQSKEVHGTPQASDVDRRDRNDRTPIMNAAEEGDAEAVRRLLASGANPNLPSGAGSALTLAMARYSSLRMHKAPTAARYHATIQALLAEPRTDPNVRSRLDEYTPLMVALRDRQDDVVEWLLAKGADPNLLAYRGQYTALRMALDAMNTGPTPSPEAERQLELLLKSKRVNLDAYVDNLVTPLTRTLAGGSYALATRLFEAGANPNATDRAGRNAIITAVESAILNPQRAYFVESVRVVAAWPSVDHGARYEGSTAVEMARAANRPDLVAILERK